MADRERATLLIAGAAARGRETLTVARALGATGGVAFVEEEGDGGTVDGVPVIGGLEVVPDHPDASVVAALGSDADYAATLRIVERLSLQPERYATLVHPTAVHPSGSSVGVGTVVQAGVVAAGPVRIGTHVSLGAGAVLGPGVDISDHATIGAGVRLCAGVQVGSGAFLGASVSVAEDVRIGAWSLVGMGAAVTGDIPALQVWAGVPARFLRHSHVRPHLETSLRRSAAARRASDPPGDALRR